MRKRITSLFLVLALCLTLLPTAALAEEASSAAQETQDSTEVGDGYTIEEDTAVQTRTGAAATGEVCRISSAEDLEAFSKRVNGGESSLNAVLVKDVSRSKNYAWESIKGYTGVFDGNGHTITLSVGGSGENNALFGSIASGGTVQDLTIQIYNWGMNVSTATGSIAYSNNGTIQRCHALSWLGGKEIGGIVYENESTGLVKDCRVGKLILRNSSENLVGGIAYINKGTIKNCYAYDELRRWTSKDDSTSIQLPSSTAIVRTNNGTVENCYYWQYDSESAVAGTPVTDKRAFTSGEVTYKLNGEKTDRNSAWRQNLPGNKDDVAVDELPVTDASHGRVYYDTSYYSLVPHLHGEEELTAWQQTDSLPDTSGSYYLTGNVTLASVQTLSNDVTLCVNGHSVNGDVTVTDSFTLTNCGSGSVTGNVTVNGGGSFTLEDCALSGKIENSGMLTVSGGTVTAREGDAVTNHGTFTMNSGTITAASGTGVANDGTLIMNGGTVTGCDKGIEGSGDITVSGKVKISGNTNGNLILPDGKTVSVGTLDSTANIGITAEKQGELTAGGSIHLTSGGAAYTTRFFADDAAAYAIFADGEDLVMRRLGEHTHCICGHPADGAENIGDHKEHTNVTFQPWTSGNSLPTTGNYYLTQNVVVNSMTVLTGTLCLNGYTISAKDGGCPVEVSSGELNLTDCAAELGSVIAAKDKAIDVYSSGKANIFNGVIRGGSGVGIYIGLNSAGANVAIYGGKITGSGTGAAVNNGTMHMYGGEIFKNSRGVQAGAINRDKHSSSGSFYLHGGKITDNHGDRGGGVYVEHNFYMDGGEVSNNSATGNGGGIYMNSGSIFLSGGKVTGNRAGGDGGGVCTKAYSNVRSYVELSGNAEISGNHAGGRGGGVYLDVYSDSGTDYLGTANWCTLTMDGGSITGNTSVGDGGGVYAAAENKRDAKSYVNVKGSAQITGNKKGEEDNNLYLPNYSGGVTIGGDLDQTADIRVTTENKPGKNSTVTIAKKSWQVSSVTVPDGVFKVDGADGKISVDDKGNVTLAPCSHSWTTYTASGAVITAKCSICSASGGSVTINKPAHTTYDDGNEAAATVTGSIPGVTAPTITYKKGDESLTAAPTDAGTYTASITLGEGNKAATASVKYTIQRADPKASDFTFAAPSPLTYDGNAKTATVKPNTGINGMGAVTVKYFKNDAETEPKDAGDYTVKVSVAEGANYNATTDNLTTDGWKFTIGKATQTITVPTDKTIVKGGIAEDISDWVTVAGVTGGSAPGTLSYMLDGSYTGVALEGNQLTVDSSVATGTTITIKVTAKETGNYNKEEQTFTVKVADKNTATVTITGLPDTVTYGQEFTLTASQTGDTTGANKKWTWDYDREYFKLVGPNANTETITLQAIKASTPSKDITATYESGTHKGSATVNAVVEKKEVTISGIAAENKEYDGGITATVNASGATITGKVDGDDLTVSVATGSTFDSADAGSRTVTLGTLTLGGTSAGNYTLATAGNQTKAAANITARDLTVKPNSGQSKSYGTTPDPVLAYTSTGTVTGETAAFDGALSREAGEDVDQYDITKGSLELKDSGTFKATNYNLVLDTAVVTFEITKVTYGGSAPTKTVNILKNYAGVQTGTLTAADFFTTAPAEAKITNAVPNAASSNMMSIAGADSSGNFTYDSKTNITAASDESWTVTISSKNYTDINATLTFKLVDKTNAGVTINDVPTTKTYGESFTLTASVTDAGTGTGSWTWTSSNSSVLDVTGTGASATVKALKSGSATISAKYESDTTMGEQTTAPITVDKRVITVTADNKSMTVNGTLPTFTVTYGNLPSGVQAADIFGTLASASTTTDGKTTGSFDITVTTPVLKTEAGANYEVGAVTKGTLTVNPRSSSGGGGGSSVSTYSVTVGKTENGSVSVSPKSASKGDTVTVTVTPDKGYTLETLTVLDKNGKELKLTEKNGKYTFTMPAGKVEVKVTFMDDNTMLNYFVDVKADNYFYDAVKWAAEKGITSGTDATHFGPNAVCTRAQIVTFLWRTAGSPEPKSTGSFADVPTDSYYAKAVAWAVENGITGGTGDGKFSPDATCTRAQAVTFLYRASGAPAVSGNAAFSDVATNAYYAAAVKWAEKSGITGGIGGGLFGSGNDCTRAQIVTFLYRSYQSK